jgi:Coenzyme PQQ synthesis protein D (PqqD)
LLLTLNRKYLMIPFSSLTINSDGFAFNVTTGESYTLNPCAQSIVQRLRSGESPVQVVQAIASEFGIAQSVIERDMADFAQQLRTLGLQGAEA